MARYTKPPQLHVSSSLKLKPQGPVVTITNPLAGSIVSGTVPLRYTKAGSVTSVKWYIDGTLHAATWDTTLETNATHTIRLDGLNRRNQVVATASLSVLVQNTPDVTPPIVAMTSPAEGATVNATVPITATASDPGGSGIASVAFYVNDGATTTLIGTRLTSPYTVNWQTSTNGAYTLTATATDGAGNQATSTAIHVTVTQSVIDIIPPTVSLTAPVANTTVSGTIVISATAADNIAIASVQFQVNSVILGTVAGPTGPYQFAWNTQSVSDGTATLAAIATDTAGNVTTSTVLTVLVSNLPLDTTPPVVVVTSPTNGASFVPGTIPLIATATDDVGVATVQFTVDGGTVGLPATAVPYQTLWTAGVGTHVIRAVATDSSGNVGVTASGVTVTVTPPPDVTPPTVSWVSPTNGALVFPGTITLQANATDNVAMASVQFAVNGVNLGAPSTGPSYQATWSPTVDAVYTLSATARDVAGNTAVASISVTVHTTVAGNWGFTVGKATFGAAFPQGAAPTGIQVGAYPTQVDVKTRWPDTSIKFAIVTANITTAGSTSVASGSSVGGSFTPTWPTVTVAFVISGVTWTATLPAYTNANPWLAGSLVNEARVVVSPKNGATPHPLLQVVFDIRSYAAGGTRVDVQVQNVLNVVGGNSVTYDVDVRIGGSSVFQQSAVLHYYLCRWRKTFLTGGLVESVVTPDFTTLLQAQLVPACLSTVVNQTYGPVTGPAYGILTFGDMNPDQGSPGGRPEIGPLPYFTVQYLVHKDPTQRAYMMKNADLGGSWSGHLTNPDGTILSIVTRPTFWFDGRGSDFGGDGPAAAVNSQIPGTREAMEVAHIPSLNYVPYLLTGDRWHVDQLKFWADFCVLWTWPGDPNQPRTGGLLTQNQVRGIGWGTRLLAEAAHVCPDTDSDQGYFSTIAQTNLTWLDTYAVTDVPPSSLVDLTLWTKFNNASDVQLSQWQLSYVGYAMYHAKRLGFTVTSAFLERVARFQISLFTSSGSGYPQSYMCPYYLQIGTVTYDGTYHYTLLNTLLQVFNRTYANGSAPPQPIAGYYGPETYMILSLGVLRGLANAGAARTYLLAQPGVSDDINNRSGFAVNFV